MLYFNDYRRQQNTASNLGPCELESDFSQCHLSLRSAPTGGKGTPRRKVAAKPKGAAGEDKKLQAALKKLNVQPVTGIEEVNMFKEDGNVLHFKQPKGELQLGLSLLGVRRDGAGGCSGIVGRESGSAWSASMLDGYQYGLQRSSVVEETCVKMVLDLVREQKSVMGGNKSSLDVRRVSLKKRWFCPASG